MMNNTNQMPGGMNKSPAKGELIPPVPGKAKPSWTTVPKGPPSPTTDKALGDKWGVSDQPEGMKMRSQKRSALGLGTSKVVRSSGHVVAHWNGQDTNMYKLVRRENIEDTKGRMEK